MNQVQQLFTGNVSEIVAEEFCEVNHESYCQYYAIFESEVCELLKLWFLFIDKRFCMLDA